MLPSAGPYQVQLPVAAARTRFRVLSFLTLFGFITVLLIGLPGSSMFSGFSTVSQIQTLHWELLVRFPPGVGKHQDRTVARRG